MSGLVGWVDFRDGLESQAAIIDAMTGTTRHRGSGAEGTWLSRHAALGARQRGAITPASRQPALLETSEGTIAAVFTGEIYNSAELRHEIELGAAAPVGSDTELLIQAFLRWGPELAAKLNGMFAFAVWDGRVRELFLVRDRLGVKPLYYFEYPGGVIFSSEPKGIMANPRFARRLDMSALPIVLQPRLALPGETPLVGLRELPPAHVLRFCDTGQSLRRFWQLTSMPHHESLEATRRHVRALLEDSVRRQMPSATTCGAMLSGGVDSTSVAALAGQVLATRHPASTLETFCVAFDSDREHFVPTELRPEVDAPYAAAAAEFIGSRHRTVAVTVQELLDAIPATRQARDLPGWGQFDASMYLLFKEMRAHCAVALTGEAADELFGGYPYFYSPELTQPGRFPWLGDGPKLSDFLAPDVVAVIDPAADEKARYSQLVSEVPRLAGEDPENARMREVFFLGMSGPLAVVLDRKERMSTSVGLEVRLPFTDHRLVEYLWNVPWQMKCSGGLKGLLKAAMADILPPAVISRSKSAYPHVRSPHYDQMLIREAMSIVNDPASPVAWMFDIPRMNDLIRRIADDQIQAALPGGGNGAYLLIQLTELQHWVNGYRVSVR